MSLYAVQSASAFTYNTKRPSFSSNFLVRIPPIHPNPVRRITINVGGERFQTYEETLARFPTSLLGSPMRRREFYNLARDEIFFPNRNKEVFNAVLFFYQARILSRPDDIPLKIFAEEIEFFELTRYSRECALTEDEITAFPENSENSLRRRTWNFLENPNSKRGSVFAKCNQFLLFTWIVMLCVESQIEPGINCKTKRFEGYWFIMNTLFVLWFTIDYLVRILCAPNRTRYVCSAEGLVDLGTILPYYLGLLVLQLSVLHFMRILRVFKASRYSDSFRLLVGTLSSSAQDFPVWLLLILIHVLFFSSILYFIEREVGNPKLSNIPDAMWFTIITICAVGYGDVVPHSALGKLVTTIAAVSGIIIVYCIPAPTLKSNFTRLNELYTSKKAMKKRLQKNGMHFVNH